MPVYLFALRFVRRNWQILLISTLAGTFVIGLGAFLFVRGQTLMEEQLKDKLRSTAAVASMQFDGGVIEKLHGPPAMRTGDFRDMVERLKKVRLSTPAIRYAYIMRKTNDPMMLEFVADADSLSSPDELDRNFDGIVEESEEASFPGDLYDVTDAPAMQGPAFVRPTVDQEFTIDKWGTTISGYAPIYGPEHTVVAILGLDMNASDYMALSRTILSPLTFLLLCVIGIVLGCNLAAYLWRRKVEALERLERERTGLLLLTLHQIGSPLTVFRWSLENLVDQSIKHGGPLKEAVQDHAKEMEHGLTQLSTIFNELQEASQIDTGTLTYNRELTSLPEVINETIITLDLELQRRRQKIVQSVDADLRLPLDRKLIAGVLRELLQNAMTFSPHDSQITLAAHRQGQRVLVEITDHGCGIPGDEMARVFDKFMRGSQAHLYQPNGSGLGLYIARGIVRRAGGEVWVRSREGKGTTVSFTLPC
jgi:signal transduction histidine kinase